MQIRYQTADCTGLSSKLTAEPAHAAASQVATLPVYLNALTGKGVHVITVNDYLAARDAEWMGKVYRWGGRGGSVSNL